MASIAETVAAAKTGLYQRLATTPGLTPADGVRVTSAVLGPDELAPNSEVVELGDVAVGVAERPGLVGRQGSPTLRGWVTVTRPLGDETAIQAARDHAAHLMSLVEETVAMAPLVDGAIQGPGGTQVVVEGLTEAPADWQGQAVRRTSIAFSITWTTHTSL